MTRSLTTFNFVTGWILIPVQTFALIFEHRLFWESIKALSMKNNNFKHLYGSAMGLFAYGTMIDPLNMPPPL
jgi:hypothetical protein